MKFSSFRIVFTGLLILALFSCQDKNRLPEDRLSGAGESISFSFACSQMQQGQLRSDFSTGTLNSNADDQVSQVRMLITDAATGNVLKSVIVYEKQSGSTELPEIAPIEGHELTLYFIANEDPQHPLDIQNPESFSIPSEPLFAKEQLKVPNYMTAVYKIRRSSSTIQYRREFPQAHPANTYYDADVVSSASVERTELPVLLFPIRSRFRLDINYASAVKMGFTEKNIQRQLKLSFKGFRKEKKLFSGDYTSAAAAVPFSDVIELPKEFKRGGKQSHLYYLPATASGEEELEVSYEQDGFSRKLDVKPYADTDPQKGFQQNTIYTLGVGFQKTFDLVIAPKGEGGPHKDPIFSRATAAPETNIENRPIDWHVLTDSTAVIHVALGHRYMSFIQLKSMNAPAELEEFIDGETEPEKQWIKGIKELTAKPYFQKVDEDGNVYYYQTFCLKYDIDTPGRTAPLISTLKFRNRRDHDKKVEIHLNFNVISRFAKMNLGKLNTFANGRTTENDYVVGQDDLLDGEYYQWGRNVSFTSAEITSSLRRKLVQHEAVYIGSSEVADESVVYYKVYDYSKDKKNFPEENTEPFPKKVYTWWKKTEDPNKPHFYGSVKPEYVSSWGRFVRYQNEEHMRANGTELPKTYLGNNEGDPCPPLYEVPLASSMKLLVYNQEIGEYMRSQNYLAKQIYGYTTEKEVTEIEMNPSGNPDVEAQRSTEVYKASYEAVGNICYALRFLPGDDKTDKRFASAYKFEYIQNRKINSPKNSAPVLDLKLSVITLRDLEHTSFEDIKKPNFWGNYEDKNNPYRENKFLIESICLGSNLSIPATARLPRRDFLIPDIWTGTARAYASALDIDMIDKKTTRVSAPHHCSEPIRCIRK